MNIIELIEAKIKAVEMADDKLVREIASVEKSLLKTVLKILKTFSTRLGRFTKDNTNAKVLTKLSKEVIDVFEKSKYRAKVEKYFLNFDKVDELNAKMHGQLSNIKIKDLGLSTSKRLAINDIVDRLLTKEAINANLTNPIRGIMYRGITSGAKFSDVEKELKALFSTNGKGHMSRYVGQVARDALLQYDGLVNQTIADEFEFDAFQIVNSLVKSSRANCVGMVKGTGKYSELSVKPGVYKMKDINRLIRTNRNGNGWNPATTESNYLIIRNGYNCRHQFIPFRLGTEAEGTLERLEKRGA